MGFDIVALFATSLGGNVLTMTWLYIFGGGGGGGVGGLGGGGGVLGAAGGSGSGGGCCTCCRRLDFCRVMEGISGGGVARDCTLEITGMPPCRCCALVALFLPAVGYVRRGAPVGTAFCWSMGSPGISGGVCFEY